MKYYEVKFQIEPNSEEAYDVLASLLADAGFEAFVPDEKRLVGYIQQSLFRESELERTVNQFPLPHSSISYEVGEAPDEDWNQAWEEEGFTPIAIDRLVCVHDTRHEAIEGCRYDIVINPRMAFGTGTHPTTRQILRQLCDMDVQDRRVVDAGCGTGVLGFLCLMRGAREVFSYDIDEWSVENTRINAQINGLEDIRVAEGDASVLPQQADYDLLIANINRNILLHDLPQFARALKKDAHLLLSGFYEEDVPLLTEAAKRLGFTLELQTCEEGWAMLLLRLKERGH